MSSTVDLNSDVGESYGAWKVGDDEAILKVNPEVEAEMERVYYPAAAAVLTEAERRARKAPPIIRDHRIGRQNRCEANLVE